MLAIHDGGSTALHEAVVSAKPIVKFLVDRGANVDAKTKLGWTPLMLAEGVFLPTRRIPGAAILENRQ